MVATVVGKRQACTAVTVPAQAVRWSARWSSERLHSICSPLRQPPRHHNQLRHASSPPTHKWNASSPPWRSAGTAAPRIHNPLANSKTAAGQPGAFLGISILHGTGPPRSAHGAASGRRSRGGTSDGPISFAELLALAWKRFAALARRDKDAGAFATTLALRCSQAVKPGCSIGHVRDALADVAGVANKGDRSRRAAPLHPPPRRPGAHLNKGHLPGMIP